ncbi:MAG: PHP domain-containing protein [Victivallales bacterium]|nr:PHP domain-containing protein [Victivallales bacterium]
MTRNPPHFKQIPAPAVDLHCHSTCSDGTVSPAGLVELAIRLGLQAIALTDHDSVAGLPAFLAEPAPGLLRLSGVELSCADERRHVHMVGLGVRIDHPPLLAMLAQVQEWRRERNREMVGRLVGLGLPMGGGELARLVEEADVLGRPHLAAALVAAGACRTVREAFTRFLGRGKPGFVPRRVPELGEAIRVIHGAGGVAIWAHPLTAGNLTVVKFQRLAAGYAERGLDGIEAYYSEFSAHQTGTVEKVAAATGILLSGGSDFHGEHIPDIALGTGYGGLHVPPAVLPPLLERIRERGGVLPEAGPGQPSL